MQEKEKVPKRASERERARNIKRDTRSKATLKRVKPAIDSNDNNKKPISQPLLNIIYLFDSGLDARAFIFPRIKIIKHEIKY